jgi:hypothetical protein
LNVLLIVLLAAIFAVGGCGKPAAPGTVPFDLHADSLGVEPMPDNAKLGANLDKAHDGLETTRWTTFGPMKNGFFIELSFDDTPEVNEVILSARPSGLDYPRGFTVELVNPDGDWENLGFYDGSATDDGITTIRFEEPRKAQRLVIRLTEDANFWWSIHEISVR